MAYQKYRDRNVLLRLLLVSPGGVSIPQAGAPIFDIVREHFLLVSLQDPLPHLEACISGLSGVGGHRFLLRSHTSGLPLDLTSSQAKRANLSIGDVAADQSVVAEFPAELSSAQFRVDDPARLVPMIFSARVGTKQMPPPNDDASDAFSAKIYHPRSATSLQCIAVCCSILRIAGECHYHCDDRVVVPGSGPMDVFEVAGIGVELCAHNGCTNSQPPLLPISNDAAAAAC
jgi:hypothetical protein